MGEAGVLRRAEEFDAAWARGETPDIAAYLDGIGRDERETLFRWLLRKDLRHRRAKGLPAEADGYRTRFPDLAGVVEDVLRRIGPAPLADVPPPGPHFPVAIPGLELLSLLGEGGQGAVYKARETATGQTVAVKVGAAGGRARDRFRAGAEIAARLRHPGIVRVQALGDVAGIPFLKMEYIQGLTLDAARRELRDGGPAAWAAYVADVAEAVHYAHEQGVIHRDLKPSNVLITGCGVKVMDFGSARDEVLDRDLTAPSALIGTPAYMAPEQIAGAGHAVDRRADVYGLGGLLYYVLAGRPAFGGNTFASVRAAVLSQPPPPVEGGPEGVFPGLWAVCLRCLAKAPSDRYPSAAHVAADLRACIAGELPPHLAPVETAPDPPAARPPGPPPTRRERLQTAAVAAAAAAVLAPAVGEWAGAALPLDEWLLDETGADWLRPLLHPAVRYAWAVGLAAVAAWLAPHALREMFVRFPLRLSAALVCESARLWAGCDRTPRGRAAGCAVGGLSGAGVAPLAALVARWAILLCGYDALGGWMEWAAVAATLGAAAGVVAGVLCGLPATRGCPWVRAYPVEWAAWNAWTIAVFAGAGSLVALCLRLPTVWVLRRMEFPMTGSPGTWALVGLWVGYTGRLLVSIGLDRPPAAILHHMALRKLRASQTGRGRAILLTLGSVTAAALFGGGLGWVAYPLVRWILARNELTLPGERWGNACLAALIALWPGLGSGLNDAVGFVRGQKSAEGARRDPPGDVG